MYYVKYIFNTGTSGFWAYFFCVTSSINFDGNDGGKFYYTRNMEDNGNGFLSPREK
jgi:hypothetical protein